jgi:ABC transporter substrate binding protein (PQQ-dependent alcohol dehydrogenase system)
VLVAADKNEVFAVICPITPGIPDRSSARRDCSQSGDAFHELWGAVQLQSRFKRLFTRGMTARDNQAWVALRMIADAVACTQSADPKTIHDDLVSPGFALGAFKRQKLTVRDWNQQLRQPISLTDGKATVSASPQEGFPHQTFELDTLGF